MINYTWRITQLERNSSNGFIVTAHYDVLAEDSGVTCNTYGTVGWEQTEDDFIPYEDLQQEVVIGWVQQKLNKDDVETSLANQIALLKNPPIISGLPWESIETQA